MNNKTKKSIISTFLLTTLLLTGCGKKSECTIPSRHVHKYTKEISEDITIEKYLASEYLRVRGYDWNEEYIEIPKEDEELYKATKNFFVGKDNWPYLYNEMLTNNDYLKFYYEYTTIETYTETDAKGNTTTKTKTVHHDGWTTNPNREDNTGRTRLYHTQFFGYRVIHKDGKYKLEKSPSVDDIREIIDEYPYFNEYCIDEMYEEFEFSKSELAKLSPDDFDIFNHPDLSNNSINNNKIRIKKIK